MKSKNEFMNKNVIITGASSGIGLSAAFYFINCNANVILVCQDDISLTKLCKENNYPNVNIMKVDVEKKSEIEAFISKATKKFQTIDILINCAGIKLDGDIEKTYPADFDFTINTNLRSVFILIKGLYPFFSHGASIINLSCLYGSRPMYGVISYAMTKAGLETLTRYAAAKFANLKIRINAISACPVQTNSLRYVQVPEEQIQYFNNNMKKNIPLGRIAHPDDIVKVIIFLASCRSSKITGQIIKVDGGRSLTFSGYVHYKGIQNMNSPLEPDSIKAKKIIDNFIKEEKILKEPIENENLLKKFIEKTISESNFSNDEPYNHNTESDIFISTRHGDTFTFNKNVKNLSKQKNDEQDSLGKSDEILSSYQFPKIIKNIYHSQFEPEDGK